MEINLRDCLFFFLPLNPLCTTTSTTTRAISSTTTTSSTTSITTTIPPTTTSTTTPSTPPTTTTTSSTSTSTTTTSSTSTTTTTTTQSPEECRVLVVTPNGSVFSYDVATNTTIYRFNAITGYLSAHGTTVVDIANSNNKLWVNFSTGTWIREFDITLNPFTATYSRDIDVGVTLGVGLALKSADTLNNIYVLVGSTPFNGNTICEITITNTGTTSTLFTMPVGSVVTGDIIYNSNTNTYIISRFIIDVPNVIYSLTEFASNGTIITNFSNIVSNIYGLFSDNGNIYAVRYNGEVYIVGSGGLTLVNTIPGSLTINGSSQDLYCITGNIPTTTTTTTILA